MPVVGWVCTYTRAGYAENLSAFLKGLEETGYVDGKNVVIEFRWAEEHPERLPSLIAELLQRQVTVIAAAGTPAALAAKAATTTVPVVFETGEDPVEIGLVANLNRPGGNVTGAASLVGATVQKQLEMLHQLLPDTKLLAALIDQNNPAAAAAQTKALVSAAHSLGVELRVLKVGSASGFEAAFSDLARLKAGGVVIGAGGVFTSHQAELAALAARFGVPAVYTTRAFVETGGLMSYGGDLLDGYRLAGAQVGRVLKGARPGDLPVQETTKVHLHLNLKTARALNISVPYSILARADEVIE